MIKNCTCISSKDYCKNCVMHMEHCCIIHNKCLYNNTDCPIILGELKQLLPCKECGFHIGHCCLLCQYCKYGDENCPVKNSVFKQDFECQFCDDRISKFII